MTRSEQYHHDITWIQPYYDLILDRVPHNAKTLLDIGAGYGVFGYIASNGRHLERLDAIEPFEGYELKNYDHVYRQLWQEWYKENKDKEHYDVAVALEVIEHMEKDVALAFLDDVRAIADVAIIATPVFFHEQDAYDRNELQRHRSLITLEELKKHQY